MSRHQRGEAGAPAKWRSTANGDGRCPLDRTCEGPRDSESGFRGWAGWRQMWPAVARPWPHPVSSRTPGAGRPGLRVPGQLAMVVTSMGRSTNSHSKAHPPKSHLKTQHLQLKTQHPYADNPLRDGDTHRWTCDYRSIVAVIETQRTKFPVCKAKNSTRQRFILYTVALCGRKRRE